MTTGVICNNLSLIGKKNYIIGYAYRRRRRHEFEGGGGSMHKKVGRGRGKFPQVKKVKTLKFEKGDGVHDPPPQLL